MTRSTTRKPRDLSPRFGIGEWYGHNILEMSTEMRRSFGEENLQEKAKRPKRPCPFQQKIKPGATCSKDGGVCSLKLFEHREDPSTSRSAGRGIAGHQGELRATCPYRFHENNTVFEWVGETILGTSNPALVGEVGFLEAGATTDNDGGDDVGRIDMVLVNQDRDADHPIEWAALEIQAVYFSGNAMKGEFKAYADPTIDWPIFPAGRRRPDYRSSGPKRLMPQLQIKVPTLRRWGKKMAVVVDRAFFDSIGEMDKVADISNADIAWFIVKFEEKPGREFSRLVPDEVRYTTLERSVEGLTGGKPVPLRTFEERIMEKIGRTPRSHRIDGEGREDDPPEVDLFAD